MSIRVSVIIPIYNTEKFLSRCLDSIINQTLEDIEIICINDGSTDNSLKILNQYAKKDKRIKIVDKNNEGQATARNIGIDMAQGEFIGFVDSDDWVDLFYFENLYNCANFFSTDIAVAGIIRQNKFSKSYHLKFDKPSITDDVNLKFKLCDVPDKSYVVNKIYKTDSLKKANIKFEDGIYYEDVIFTPLALYYLKTLVTVPEIYYYYWRHNKSTVRQRNNKINQDSVYAHKKAKNFCKEHNIDISELEVKTTRLKLFGLTIVKIIKKGQNKIFCLFNIFKLKI